MTTFSQLVDSMARETMRPDYLVNIVSYLNQAIREVHFDPVDQKAALFKANFIEDQLTATTETGFTWEMPHPERWQAMQIVRYDSVYDRDGVVYPPEMVPSRGLAGLKYYFYQAGFYYAFAGYGGINGKITVGYYEFPRKLKYYPVADRLVTYDEELGFQYDVSLNTPELRAAEREKHGNWLLDRWDSVLEEAVRAKVYKRASDDGRARTAYSAYMLGRAGLLSSESAMVANYQ